MIRGARSHLGRAALIGAILLAGFGALAGAMFWLHLQGVTSERQAAAAQAHIQGTVVEAERLTTALADTQDGIRGYLLTRDPDFLDRYATGAQTAPVHLRRLRELTLDHPVQQRRLELIAGEIGAVLELSGRMQALETSGQHEAAVRLLRAGGGKRVMDRARSIIADVLADEQRLTGEQQAAAARANLAAVGAAYGLGIAGAALLLTAFAMGWLALAAAARAHVAELRAEASQRLARSAEQLAASEARQRAILETATDAILVIDEAGVIQSVNPATEALFGYAVEEMVGRNVRMLMPEPYSSEHDAYIAAYLNTGERKVIGAVRELEGLRKDGRVLPLSLSVTEWRVGGRRFFTGFHADISARKRAEAQLREREAQLSLFIEGAPAAIAMFDRRMRYLAVSRRYAVDYDLPAEIELIGKSHYEIFRDIPQSWRDIHARVLAGEALSCEEDSFRRADGRVAWMRWRMEPWRDQSGEIGGALLFSEVITAQVEVRRAHLAAEERLRAIVETAADAIIVIDEAAIIQSVNPATEAMFGYRAEEMIGRNVSMLTPEPHRSAHDSYVAAYLQTGERKVIGIGRELEALRKDGSRVPIDLTVAEWRVEGQRFFTGVMRDISARKLAEAERLQAERRELVVGELRHRISNMFAVIQSLVVATARSHHEVAAYRDAVLDRINAFAATQTELARQAWSSLRLRDLIEFELRPYREAGQHVLVEGDELSLNGAAAQNVAMIVHELATNAAKYGALGRPGATLRVGWKLTDSASGERRLALEWVERGGPAVSKPAHRGFGATVIESSARALGGAAKLDYAPEGLQCTLDMPAARVLSSE